MKRILLKSFLSPGDIVVMTAMVRDLQTAHPGKFEVFVSTTCEELWENNPFATVYKPKQGKKKPPAFDQIIECHYPLINQSNQGPWHFIHGYRMDLEEKLGVKIPATLFKGDIHISEQERSWISQVEEVTGDPKPFWIVVSGGKTDYTIKWWSHKRFQEIVSHFRGRIRFVQVGSGNDKHPPLDGAIDLRGKTSLRQLVRLVYHAQGVLCPVTSLMHLAAAVPSKEGDAHIRPCVVVAGGREPVQWEAYPGHQFLHTIGALPCCISGGCWKARTVKIHDGDEKDNSLCLNAVSSYSDFVLPKCMDLISTKKVIEAIQLYFNGGAIRYLEDER